MRILFKFFLGMVWVVFLVVLAMVGLTFLPASMSGGLKAFTVQSGSMEPAIKTGSLIFVKPAETYEVGDVATRTTGNSAMTVTHRIIEKDGSGTNAVYVTKGDANNAEDPEPLPNDEVVGKLLFGIPFLGYPVAFAKTSRGFVLLIIIPAVLIIIDEVLNIKNEIKQMRRRKLAKKGSPPNLFGEAPDKSARSEVKINKIEISGISKDINEN